MSDWDRDQDRRDENLRSEMSRYRDYDRRNTEMRLRLNELENESFQGTPETFPDLNVPISTLDKIDSLSRQVLEAVWNNPVLWEYIDQTTNVQLRKLYAEPNMRPVDKASFAAGYAIQSAENSSNRIEDELRNIGMWGASRPIGVLRRAQADLKAFHDWLYQCQRELLELQNQHLKELMNRPAED